ncbi:MAG TPA: hypothetical protein VGM56_07650 [Byssovorax sp.]|jgi:hypothetical protein
MRRRRRAEDGILFSLDSFLDIVTNVVGVLVLVAMVTTVSAGSISVPAGTAAMTTPGASAERVLFECAGDQVFVVDEAAAGRRVLEALSSAGADVSRTDEVIALLDAQDVGDESHRVRAERRGGGLAWVYTLRRDARGDRAADLSRRTSTFQRALASLGSGGFAYFVVHDDAFATFERARDAARAGGVAVGWYPVAGREALRLATTGSLGKQIQ